MRIPTIPGFDPQAFEKYLKNTGWLMFGKVLSLGVGLIIARYLGPGRFGDLSFATAFTGIILAVGSLGLDSFIIRELLNEPSRRDEILGTSFWLRFSVSLLLVPLTVLIYWGAHQFSDQPDAGPLTLIVALCATAIVFKAFNIIDSYFQSEVRSKYVVQVQNICLVVSAAIKVLLVWLALPLVYFALALVIDGLLLAVGLIIIYHREGLNIFSWTFNSKRGKDLLKKSWPLIISSIMVSLYMQIDVVMLKNSGSEEVGVYSVASKLSEAWYFIPMAIVTSVFPALIQARKTDPERYQRRLQNLYDLLVGISLPVALIVSFSAEYVIDILYGAQYQGAGAMLAIHIWSGIFVFLGTASTQYLLAEGFTQVSFIRTGFGALINIGLNIWLIPQYGGIGASIATLIAYFSATFFIVLIPKTRLQGVLMFKSLFLISLIQKLVKR
jgi:O-antigen/teichoic acid export membrane protein